MKNEITLQTRRQFLRSTVLGGALSWTVPAFLADTFAALQAGAADAATQTATGKDATILALARDGTAIKQIVRKTGHSRNRVRVSRDREHGFHCIVSKYFA